ncbi:MAG: outer membrane protein transport protein, partial [Nitrospirota bacterium]|nr:outer membrane protein transport protein [Nitrospirota bacterium]
SLNVDYQSLTFDQSINDGAGTVMYQLDLGRPSQQLGFGATAGVLFDVNEQVTLGFNYISKQSFSDAQYRLGFGDVDTTMAGGGPMPAGKYKLGIEYPQQAALGVAVQPMKNLLVDLDIKWINWSSTHDVVTLTTPGGPMPLTFGWDDQIVYALGAQYVVSDRFKVRAGFNYGESPIGQEDVMSNLIFPAVQETHVTLGADYLLGEHWGVGGAYMKAFSNDVTGVGDVPVPLQGAFGGATDSGFKIGLEEQAVGILLYYLF